MVKLVDSVRHSCTSRIEIEIGSHTCRYKIVTLLNTKKPRPRCAFTRVRVGVDVAQVVWGKSFAGKICDEANAGKLIVFSTTRAAVDAKLSSW